MHACPLDDRYTHAACLIPIVMYFYVRRSRMRSNKNELNGCTFDVKCKLSEYIIVTSFPPWCITCMHHTYESRRIFKNYKRADHSVYLFGLANFPMQLINYNIIQFRTHKQSGHIFLDIYCYRGWKQHRSRWLGWMKTYKACLHGIDPVGPKKIRWSKSMRAISTRSLKTWRGQNNVDGSKVKVESNKMYEV